MDWGAEIKVNGVRPVWLRDAEPVRIGWGNEGCRDRNWSNPGAWNAKQVTDDTYEARTWKNVAAIRLPGNHFTYVAIAEGFEPWAGGERAPADWDGLTVLLSDGCQSKAFVTGSAQWSRDHEPSVIGYRKKVVGVTPKPDHESVKALLTEIRDLLKPTTITPSSTEFRYDVVDFGRGYRPPEPAPLTITITGPQGSGKTRWAELLRSLPMKLLGYPVPVIVDGEEG